jgi:hypothetical protein
MLAKGGEMELILFEGLPKLAQDICRTSMKIAEWQDKKK